MKQLLICIVLFSFNLSHSQINSDSLRTVWNDQSKSDSIRLKAGFKLMYGFFRVELDSGIHYANEIIDFTTKRNLKSELALTYKDLGPFYSSKGDKSKAIECFTKAEKIYTELGSNNGLKLVYNHLGSFYANNSKNEKAIYYYKKAINLTDESDARSFRNLYLNLSSIYNDNNEPEEAIKYLNKVELLFAEESKKEPILPNNIGAAYFLMGDYNKALDYYNQALTISEETNNQFYVAISKANISEAYYKLGQLSEAQLVIDQSLKVVNEGKFNFLKPFLYNNLGDVYKGMKRYSKSIDAYNEALKFGTSYTNTLELKRSNEALYEVYKITGKYDKALSFLEGMVEAKDSLKEVEVAKKLQNIEFDNERLKDSLQNEEAKLKTEMVHQAEVREKDKNKNLALGAGLFFLLISGGLYSRWRFTKKAKSVIEKEKDRSDNLLLNILPSEVAEELKEKGEAEAKDYEMVSILFSDFKGFTGLSEKMSAKDLVANINECFKSFDAIMQKYNVEKIKTIGDAYMAAGGLPVNSQTSVKDTVLAALEMQEFIIKLHKNKEAKGEHAFEMRVGIHTGPVVAGIVGVKKFQYDIWGDTVNTASRMESSGEVGKVNISEDTYNHIKDEIEFSFETRGKIKAKGKGEVEMYFVSRNVHDS